MKKDKADKGTKDDAPLEDIVVDGYPQDKGELVESGAIKRGGFLSRIPAWLKVLFFHFWFGGACYFFIGWGLFGIPIGWISTVILGLAYGLLGDLMINTLLKAVIRDEKLFCRSILFHSKKFYSILINCVYGLLLAWLITLFYIAVNATAVALGFPSDKVFLGAEPLLVGLVYSLCNLFFVTIKNLAVSLAQRRRGIEGEKE